MQSGPLPLPSRLLAAWAGKRSTALAAQPFGEERTSFYQSEELIDTINGMKDKSLFKKKSTGFGTPTGYGVKEQHVGR